MRRRPALLLGTGVLGLLSACAPNRVTLPTGAGTPFAEAPAAYQSAVAECRQARTIQATLSLSGRAGSTRIRGTVDASFEAPEKARLEGRYPIGRPAFILVTTDRAQATLSLPRDNRVLRNAAAADIMAALVGLPLGASELRSLVAGCGFEVGEPTGGRQYPGGWVAATVGASEVYLRQIDSQWRLVAARRDPFSVHYDQFTSGRAGTARVQAAGPSPADVTARISDVDINVTIDPRVFEVEVEAGAEPLTLDELRRAGPLGGQ